MVRVIIDLPDDINTKVELFKIQNQCKNENGKLDKKVAVVEMLRRCK